MDIGYFFNERIEFIRQFYNTASAPYIERKRKIEAEEEPFIPPYSEDGEPPFIDEWIEAEESLQVLAYSCVSMISAALHLYFETWIKQSRCPVDESLKKSVFKRRGWLSGYKTHFSQQFAIEFDATQINYSLLEEVILARNCIQHPFSIIDQKTQYSKSDLKKLRHPFFVDDREAILSLDVTVTDRAWFFPPTLHVTDDKLIAAISEVERFANWFEAEIEKKVYAKHTSKKSNKL